MHPTFGDHRGHDYIVAVAVMAVCLVPTENNVYLMKIVSDMWECRWVSLGTWFSTPIKT